MVATIVAGSGLPETPIFLEAVNGTGTTGTVRPNRTSAPLYAGSSGHFLNADAFTAPTPGQWGNAARDSIIGPDTFTFNASASRTFRVGKRLNLDIRVDATNVMNHPVYSAYNTVLNPVGTNQTFGLPVSVAAMRSLQTTARLRF